MRDIDTFNWPSILENAKKFSKITEHLHYILKILLIFLYVET